jgi:hypothetical protein
MGYKNMWYNLWHGDGTQWVDIDFPIELRSTGSNRPNPTTLVGDVLAPTWAIGDNLELEDQEIIHGYMEGSDIIWHVHLVTNGTDVTDRYVKWRVTWAWANPNSAISAQIVTESDDILIPANTPDRTHFPRNIATISLPDLRIGAHIWARLDRIAATGTAPTGNVFCSALQLHVECDSTGSRLVTTKF